MTILERLFESAIDKLEEEQLTEFFRYVAITVTPTIDQLDNINKKLDSLLS